MKEKNLLSEYTFEKAKNNYADLWEKEKKSNGRDDYKKIIEIEIKGLPTQRQTTIHEEDKESFIGYLHFDEATGAIYIVTKEGEKIALDNIDDIKKLATKKLLKK